MVQGVSGKKRLLVRFQDGYKNGLTLDQLTVVIVEKSPVEEEPEAPTITEIHNETFLMNKGYYHGFHVVLHFHKEGGFHRKEDQADVYLYPDEEDMEDVKLDDERERHYRIMF